MSGYYNIFKTSLGYISLNEMRDEYFLTYTEYEALGNAKKGDKVKVGDEDIVCMGTFAELLEENEKLKRSLHKARDFGFRKVAEIGRLKENLKKLSALLKPILSAMEINGVDIIDTETGELLSD